MSKPFPLHLRKLLLSAGGGVAVVLVGIQLIHPLLPNPPVTGDFQAPPKIKAIVQRACYDCHSNQTNLRWYDKVAPAYWQVANDVRDGRAGLNFSSWQSLAPADQKAKLWEAVNQVVAGAMPLKEYTVVHPSAKLSGQDVDELKRYVASMATYKPADSALLSSAAQQYRQWQGATEVRTAVPIAANGVAYQPDYKNWQPISTTERFDNGTLRVVLGNAVAVQAIHDKQTNPWPDGTTFAKVAWDQVADAQGRVRTGAFKQVEFMIKDERKYAATKGWGWARFKTLDLVPYGQNALFTTECINCHIPRKNQDFVFTTPLSP
jgi:mono/diheme cytochrome c family protein